MGGRSFAGSFKFTQNFAGLNLKAAAAMLRGGWSFSLTEWSEVRGPTQSTDQWLLAEPPCVQRESADPGSPATEVIMT